MPLPPNPQKQQGTAIFMALFFVVLVTSIAISWYLQSRVAVKRTRLMITADQAYLSAQEMLNLEIELLKTSLKKTSQKTKLSWPILLNKRASSKGTLLYGRIDDYQARLNINNMTEPDTKAAFIRILTELDPTTDSTSALQLADNVIAWITATKLLSPAMLEINASYSRKNPPYRAANRPMHSLSELRLVKGIRASIFLKLEPFISALPPKTPINLQHASEIVFRAYHSSPQSSPAEVVSEFFLARSEVEIQKLHLVLYTLLHRTSKNEVELEWQSQGSV